MLWTKEELQVLLSEELEKIGCTLEDAEQVFADLYTEKQGGSTLDTLKSLVTISSLGAATLGIGSGLGAYLGYKQLEDSEKKKRNKQIMLQQYDEAINRLKGEVPV
jgi:hypothetical protein